MVRGMDLISVGIILVFPPRGRHGMEEVRTKGGLRCGAWLERRAGELGF